MSTVHVFSWHQIIVLKNLYDNDLFPEKIGLVQETGDLIVEYKETLIGRGGIFSEMRTIKIPREETELH